MNTSDRYNRYKVGLTSKRECKAWLLLQLSNLQLDMMATDDVIYYTKLCGQKNMYTYELRQLN